MDNQEKKKLAELLLRAIMEGEQGIKLPDAAVTGAEIVPVPKVDFSKPKSSAHKRTFGRILNLATGETHLSTAENWQAAIEEQTKELRESKRAGVLVVDKGDGLLVLKVVGEPGQDYLEVPDHMCMMIAGGIIRAAGHSHSRNCSNPDCGVRDLIQRSLDVIEGR